MKELEQKEKSALISVIIPCRNEENHIEKTIESLLNQKNINGGLEIIVVDGMSEDGTRKILNEFSEKFSNIKIVDNLKIVTPFALNLGIKNSNGEFLCIMGAHAEYANDYLSSCLKLMKEHTDVSCVGGPIIGRGKNNFAKAAALAMSSLIGVGNAKHRFPNYEGYAEMACFPMFRRKVFDEIGLYDETLVKNQDDEFCFRLIRNGGKVYISPIAKSYYYVRESASELFKQYFQYGFWRTAVLKKHKLPISFRQQVPILFFLSLIIFITLGIILNNIFIAAALPSIYIFTLFLFSIKILSKEGLSIFANFFLALFILHFSYAAGFFSGIFNLFLRRD